MQMQIQFPYPFVILLYQYDKEFIPGKSDYDKRQVVSESRTSLLNDPCKLHHCCEGKSVFGEFQHLASFRTFSLGTEGESKPL